MKHDVFQIWLQKIADQGSVTGVSGGCLLICFRKKMAFDAVMPKTLPRSHSLWTNQIILDDMYIYQKTKGGIFIVNVAAKVNMNFKGKVDFSAKTLYF